MPKQTETQPSNVVSLNQRRLENGLPAFEGRPILYDQEDKSSSSLPYSERVRQRQNGQEKMPKWMKAVGLIAVAAVVVGPKIKETINPPGYKTVTEHISPDTPTIWSAVEDAQGSGEDHRREVDRIERELGTDTVHFGDSLKVRVKK